jgi:hypothetical protein
MDKELKKAIAVIFQYIEETQAGDWNELKEMLEELEQEVISTETVLQQKG